MRQYNPNSAGSQHYSNAAGSLRTHGSGELSEAYSQILSAKTPWREGLADDCRFLLYTFVHRRLRSTPNAALDLHPPRRHRIHRRHLRRHIARRLARRPTLSIRFVHRCTSQAVDLLQNLLSDERPLVNRQPGRAPPRVSKLLHAHIEIASVGKQLLGLLHRQDSDQPETGSIIGEDMYAAAFSLE